MPQNSNLNWYVKGHENVLKWLIIVFISVIFFRGKDFVQNQNLLRLICFNFVALYVSNVASLVPSGGQFIALFEFVRNFIHNFICTERPKGVCSC